MIPMAVMPASAAYDYDETAKISFKKYVGYLSGIANSVISLFTGLVVSVYMLLEREMIMSVLKRLPLLYPVRMR